MSYLYVKYANDKIGLPLAVADSPSELARIVGTTRGAVLSAICHKHKTFAKVEVDDDDETTSM